VAEQSLKTAMDQWLGKLLPNQQPNPILTHLSTIYTIFIEFLA